MYQTKTQIKLGGPRREAPPSSGSGPHGGSGGGGAGGGSSGRPLSGDSSFSFNCFKSLTQPSEPSPLDDMPYLRSTRIVVTIDIIVSTFLLVAYIIALISGFDNEKYKTIQQQQSNSSLTNGTESFTAKKQKETLIVLVWVGLFAVCILQLLVAGGMLGGTYERDGRKTIRNCRIWMVTTTLSVLLVLLQLIFLLIFGRLDLFYVQLSCLAAEIAFRSLGLLIVSKFIRELYLEFGVEDGDGGEEDFDLEDRIYYHKLLPSPNTIIETHSV